ncbi:MAG: tRNA lysidine(34) synthetase TilS [Bacteroidales bacterium]|nr:MAG: tRNA lysidine(34) synthetase TilS [Bacteroidales bacterium]
MQSNFVDFIRSNNLVSASDEILLGVSGGVDSMVMLTLFRKAGFKVSVAHCNFSLRSDESDGDEQLVAYECEINGINLHRIKFETESYAEEHKLSIQVAARNLRYDFFNRLCVDFGYTKIAIAHNRDDVAETVIFNLTRGTGLKGLSGIKMINGKVIRPLLFASRDDITRYAVQNAVSYRDDSSNLSTKYARNRIRHNVLPELEQLNPSAKKAIAETANHVHESWSLVEDYLSNLKAKLVKQENNRILFDIQGLSNEKYSKLFLFEELGAYGFSYDTLEQVVASIHGQSGKIFYSSSHQLLRDREFIILTERKETDHSIVQIDKDCKSMNYPINLRFDLFENSDSFAIQRDSSIAALDFDKLTFPLKLRPWQPGDRFMPFGMDKFKKVSDFLIDQKISLVEKDQIYVLTSKDEIVWVVGKRIDDKFKVTPETKSIWQSTFNN